MSPDLPPLVQEKHAQAINIMEMTGYRALCHRMVSFLLKSLIPSIPKESPAWTIITAAFIYKVSNKLEADFIRFFHATNMRMDEYDTSKCLFQSRIRKGFLKYKKFFLYTKRAVSCLPDKRLYFQMPIKMPQRYFFCIYIPLHFNILIYYLLYLRGTMLI